MSAVAHEPNQQDYRLPADSFLATTAWKVSAALAVVGLLGSVAGFVADSNRFGYSYLFGFFAVTTLMLGAMFMVLIQHMTAGHWGVTSRRIFEVFMAGAPVIFVLALPILTYPLGRDQGEFATIASGILDGKTPYVELWNPKPPAVFYTYALAMAVFGHTTMALRAIDLLMVPVICAALYWLGKRIANANVGLWAALIFPTFYFSESFWTLTQNDGIAILPMVLAMVAMFKAGDAADAKRGALWAFLCGEEGRMDRGCCYFVR